MKNRGKRFIVLLLSVLMVVSQMSFIAFATEPAAPETPSAEASGDGSGETDVISNESAAVENNGEEAGGDGGESLLEEPQEEPVKALRSTSADKALKGAADDGEEAKWNTFSITNLSGAPLVIRGISDKGTPFTDVLNNSENPTRYGLLSLDYIYSSKVVMIQKDDLDHEDTTSTDYDGYPFCMVFDDLAATGATYNLTIKPDTSRKLIQYFANGGSGTMETEIAKVDTSSYKLSKNRFEKGEDNVFIGWATEKNGNVVYTDEKEIELTKDGKNLSLYAKWHQHQWEYTYDPNNHILKVNCKWTDCPYAQNKTAPFKLKLITNADRLYNGRPYQEGDFEVKLTEGEIPPGFDVPDEYAQDNAIQFFDKDGKELDEAPSDAGQYSMTVHLTYNGEPVAAISSDFTIKKKPLTITALNAEKEYGQPDPKLEYTVSELGYGDTIDDALEGEIARDGTEKVGSYYIRQGSLKAKSNYRIDSFKDAVFTIKKSVAVVTKAPIGNTGLKYDGSPKQLLAEAGTAEGGSMRYCLEKNGTYTNDITEIVGDKAGNYTVWYKAKGDDNHANSEPQSLTVNIAQKVVEIKWQDDLVYNGQDQQPEAWAVDPDTGNKIDALAVVVSGTGKDAWQIYNFKASLIDTNYAPKSGTDSKAYLMRPSPVRVYWGTSEFAYDGTAKAPDARVAVTGPQIKSFQIYQVTVDKNGNTHEKRISEAVVPGSYSIYAVLDDPNYTTNEVIDGKGHPFTIVKGTYESEVKISDWEYGKTPSTPSVTYKPEGATVVYEYAEYLEGQESVLSEYTTKVPDHAGSFNVRATISATDYYNQVQVTKDFFVTTAQTKLTVTMNDWTYGGTASTPQVEGNVGGADLRYWYYGTKSSGDAYSSAKAPKVPGSYTVKVVADATPNSDAAEGRAAYKINKADAKFDVSITGWSYKGYASEKNGPNVTWTEGIIDPTYELWVKDKSEPDEKYFKIENLEDLNTLPVGDYIIKVTFGGDDLYDKSADTANFTVSKADLPVKVTSRAPLTYMYDNAKGEAVAQPLVDVTGNYAGSGIKVYFSLTRWVDYSETIPVGTDAKRYDVYYWIDGGDNYKDRSKGIDLLPDMHVTIDPASIENVGIEQVGWTFGEYDAKTNAPKFTGLPGDCIDPEVTQFFGPYNEAMKDDGDFDETVPTDAGHYLTYALLDCGSNYKPVITTMDDFYISKAELKNFSVSVGDWTYGTKPNEPVVSGNDGGGKVTFRYQKKVGDNQYTDFDPESGWNAGEYRVVTTVAETKNYLSKSVWPGFKVKRAVLKAKVSAEGWRYKEYKSKVNGPAFVDLPDYVNTKDVSFKYVKLEDDNTPEDYPEKQWSNAKDIGSVTPGTYAIKGYVKENTNYESYISDPVEITVSKGDPEFDEKALPKANEIGMYDGNSHALLVAGDEEWDPEWGTIQYAVTLNRITPAFAEFKDLDDITTAPSGTEAKTYHVWVRVVSDCYETSKAKRIDVTIPPASATSNPPVARTGLVYNGEDQELVTVDNKNVRFKVGPFYIGTKIPVGKDAGTYEVEYKILGDKNHEDVEGKVSGIVIAPASFNIDVKMDDWVYGEGAKAPKVSGNVSGGKESLLYYSVAEDKWSTDVPTALGSYVVNVKVAATSNYVEVNGYGDFRIVAANIHPAVEISGWSYGGYNRRINGPKITGLPSEVVNPVVSYQVAVLGNGVTMDNLEKGDFRPIDMNRYEEEFNALNAGDYAVIAKVNAGPNYNESTTRPVKLTVSKANNSFDKTQLPEAVKGLVYDGTAKTLVTSEGKTWDDRWGKIQYAVNSGIDIIPPKDSEYKDLTASSKPQGTAANIYYVWLRVVPNDQVNYKVSDEGFRLVNIKRAEAEGAIVENDLVYNGNKQELVTVLSENVRFKHGIFYTKGIPTAKDAGTYTVHYKILGKGSTKDVYGEMAVTIAPKTVGIYWGQDELTYDGTDQGPDVDAGIGLTGVISEDDFSFSINHPDMIDAGSYVVQISDLDNDNYVLPDEDECEHIYDIDKADLTVTAGDAVIDYGEKAPRKVGLRYKGFKGDDDESCLSGTAAFSFGGYEQYEPAGNYEITVDGLYSENYYFIYAPGNLEVETLPVTVVWSGDMAVAYDGKQHSVSAKLSGLLPRDEDNELVWIELSGDTTATAEGNYTAKAVLAGKPYNESVSVSDNYYIADGSGTCKWKIVNEYDPAAEAAARAEAEANAQFLGVYSCDVPKAKNVKIKAGKKSFTVNWTKLSKKQRKKFTKVEIQYCKDGKFNRNSTIVKERAKSKTSYKVKGLKKGSKYYVRVRDIRYSYDKKYVSKWSKVKKIKIK